MGTEQRGPQEAGEMFREAWRLWRGSGSTALGSEWWLSTADTWQT